MRTNIIAKTLVFNDRGHVLLLVRSDDDVHRAGGHDFPGGNIEEGEEIVAGAVREADEEAGLQLDPRAMRLLYADTKVGFKASLGADANLVKLVFATRISGQQVVLSHEHKAFAWLPVDKAIASIDYPSGVEALRYVRDHRLLEDLKDDS